MGVGGTRSCFMFSTFQIFIDEPYVLGEFLQNRFHADIHQSLIYRLVLVHQAVADSGGGARASAKSAGSTPKSPRTMKEEK